MFWSCLACGYVKILQPVAMCSYFRNIFPPWSSQMTIILITNAMYHIRYTNGEYEFKRKNPTDELPQNINITNRPGKPPTIQEETLSRS